jgi:hypothetical protein
MVKKLWITGLLCASLALAQGGHGGGKNNSSSDAGQQTGGPPPSNRFDFIASALNLNKDQKKTVRTILEDGAKEAAPIREQMSKSRIAVGEAITANKSEDDLKQIAKTSSDFAAQLAELELRTFAKTFGALDDSQKKDMRALSRVLVIMRGMYQNKNWNEE